MPFNAGEYVRSKSGNWYGQVVRLIRVGVYRVRIGGTDSTRDLPEADLEFQMGHSIAPRVFPPVRTLSTSITLPALAYPFSNEPGFAKGKPLWHDLGVGGIDPGAVVGVSGSVLDLAAAAGASCSQIVSTDINSCTTQYIDQLRRILVAITEVGQINLIKRHFRTGVVISTRSLNSAEFFKHILDNIKNIYLTAQDALAECTFQNAVAAASLGKELKDLDQSMKKVVTTYFSNWYDDAANFVRLAALIKQGNFFLLCGDLSKVATLTVLHEALDHPITIFNISNALDYITNLDPIIEMFLSFRHTASAKVVSSSQSPRSECVPLLGSFEAPKVHRWDEFVTVLRTLKENSLSGTLL